MPYSSQRSRKRSSSILPSSRMALRFMSRTYCSSAKSANLLPAIQEIQGSENGNFYPDRHGRLAFRSRSHRYTRTTPSCTFGEDTAGGEYPYLGDLTYDIDPTLIVNIATVTRSGGVATKIVDQDSVRRFFPNSYERTINTASDADAGQMASWIVGTRKDPYQRVASITVDPVGFPALWPIVLRMEIGTRVRVTRRAKAANGGLGATISEDYFVEAVGHDGISMEACTWRVSLLLSPAWPMDVFVVEDPDRGRLDSSSSTLGVSASSSATTLVVNSSAPYWTADPADVPFDVEVDGEQIRVTAVSGTTSPQTMTVTRSVNGRVKAHAAGTKVSLWRPGKIAL